MFSYRYLYNMDLIIISSFKGWIFNVVPWVVTIPSSVFSGWLADHLIKKGYTLTFTRKAMEVRSQLLIWSLQQM